MPVSDLLQADKDEGAEDAGLSALSVVCLSQNAI